MCAATDLSSCRWNFRSVYTSVLALGRGAVERSGRTNLQSQTYYKLAFPSVLSLRPFHRALVSFIVVLSAPDLTLEAPGPCRCYDKVTYPVSRADVHSASFHQHFVIRQEQTLWEQIRAAQRIGHKKSCREPDRASVLKKGMGGEAGKERSREVCRAEFYGFWFFYFFIFWFIQRLSCVGYSKSSIHPHPGGKSSELQAWVVLHLTAAIQ